MIFGTLAEAPKSISLRQEAVEDLARRPSMESCGSNYFFEKILKFWFEGRPEIISAKFEIQTLKSISVRNGSENSFEGQA